jgi:hypothetical protein
MQNQKIGDYKGGAQQTVDGGLRNNTKLSNGKPRLIHPEVFDFSERCGAIS